MDGFHRALQTPESENNFYHIGQEVTPQVPELNVPRLFGDTLFELEEYFET